MLHTTPSRTLVNAVPAGPITSLRALRLKAAALGVDLALCADGVRLDGHVHAGLAEVDADLDRLALAAGVDLAPVTAEATRAAAAARGAAFVQAEERAKHGEPFRGVQRWAAP